ncbi:ATP-dependent helicase/nuclease subunit A [Rhizomicrobium palustre]|uniref:DNA 3'-5' helicase n=1 Tax=Rhizomicrobium palustre TaxID=189966 RepID=A0A846N5N2_9PROT|nr:double-strand break repair helicase AddA [Rhizomicrobium palustre]NIK90491.1 ATP-dependent helicase/nuclease subunit A [Rhizomicrobium palustre]
MKAAEPNLSAWVAANAGAGKTYTLAARVTRLLLAGAAPERILCLTYTKAAAAEMFDRLFKQLGEWSMLSDSALAERIEKIGADPGSKEDLRAARRLFAKALETPGGLKIQTIHSFCQYVLSRFPLEAGVPASFKVLDDRSASELLATARARVFERAARDAELNEAVVYLATRLSDAKLQQILDSALTGDRGKLDAFFEKVGSENWTALVRKAHGASEDDTPESLAKEFCAGLKREEDKLKAAIAWLSSGSKTDGERGAALAAAKELLGEMEQFDGICAVVLTKDGTLRKALATKKLIEARPDLAAWLGTLGETVLSTLERLNAAKAAMLADAALKIIFEVRDVYAAEKRARNFLDYDDLIVRTHRLLNQHGAAWVLYKLDEGIDHILIDEAQDTSGLQWDIIQKLTEEFFAGEGVARAPRTLFAVGDEKQSIFSFQGADPRQFERRRAFFAKRAEEGQREFLYQPLQDSWRSAPQILSFVDQTFASAEARDGLTSSDTPIKHNPLKDLKGCVEFWPPISASDGADLDPWDLRPVDMQQESSPVVQLAEQIAGRIRQWLDDGAALPGHDKPISPGDIMILLPRREPFGSEIIKRLKEHGVPVAGADRIVLTEQIAVMDLIAYGRFALLPEDDLNLAALLRSPLIGISESELFELAHGRKGTLWEALSARKTDFPEAYQLLSDARARADYAPPYEYYAHALLDGRRKLLNRLGVEARDAIDEFLSLALQYEMAATPSLEGFLHWMETGTEAVKRDMERGRDEVRVMTVHGAKGLEADIVILPDTTRLPTDSPDRGNLLYTDDGVLFPVPKDVAPAPVLAAKDAIVEAALKEYRRLLYVALTRARERLIVCGFENKKGTKPGSWHDLAGRAAEALGVAREDGVKIFGESALVSLGKQAKAAPDIVTLPDWARTSANAEQPAPWLIRPSQAAGMDEPASPSPLGAVSGVKRGQLVHTLLARLPDMPEELRRQVALQFLSARGVENPEPLVAQVLAVLDNHIFGMAFAPGSRAEVSLVADLPEIGPTARVHGRVDRLAVTGDEVLIVDFKTGRPLAQEQDVPRLYATQMALYRAAAMRIFPGKRISCSLVWTEGPLLLPLSPGFLDEETARIRSRLDQEGGAT